MMLRDTDKMQLVSPEIHLKNLASSPLTNTLLKIESNGTIRLKGDQAAAGAWDRPIIMRTWDRSAGNLQSTTFNTGVNASKYLCCIVGVERNGDRGTTQFFPRNNNGTWEVVVSKEGSVVGADYWKVYVLFIRRELGWGFNI